VNYPMIKKSASILVIMKHVQLLMLVLPIICVIIKIKTAEYKCKWVDGEFFIIFVLNI
jgi:hypothetical protein